MAGNVKKITISGTLGDAFVVLCKLYSNHQKTGSKFEIIRYSRHPDMDRAIRKLFGTVPFVEYKEPCRAVANGEKVLERIKADDRIYVNTCWHRGKDEGFEDPPGFEMEPYPDFNLSAKGAKEGAFNLGVQLHCGKLGHNFRGFSPKWVLNLSQNLHFSNLVVHIFGTGEGYKKEELEMLDKRTDLKNWVGKTELKEWLRFIKGMDAFVSLEGFSAFFAMSQKIPTILYNQYRPGIEDSIHPAWEKNNKIVNLNKNRILNKIRILKMKKLGKRNLYSPKNYRELNKFMANYVRQEK